MSAVRSKRRVRCGSCQLTRINGLVCHEIGCPNAWKGYLRECKWCGRVFRPRAQHDHCCSKSCGRAYYG